MKVNQKHFFEHFELPIYNSIGEWRDNVSDRVVKEELIGHRNFWHYKLISVSNKWEQKHRAPDTYYYVNNDYARLKSFPNKLAF